jgi:hypothetical protein
MRTRCRLSRAKGDVVYLDDMEGSAVCLGPALTFMLVDFIVPLAWPWSSATAPEQRNQQR